MADYETVVIPCPLAGYDGQDDDGTPLFWIEVPDEWYGLHTRRYEQAIQQGVEAGLETQELLKFAASLALLEDWRLPGLDGKPENWDFTQLPGRLMAWVNSEAYTDYRLCQEVPKAYLPRSLRQSGEKEKAIGGSGTEL